MVKKRKPPVIKDSEKVGKCNSLPRELREKLEAVKSREAWYFSSKYMDRIYRSLMGQGIYEPPNSTIMGVRLDYTEEGHPLRTEGCLHRVELGELFPRFPDKSDASEDDKLEDKIGLEFIANMSDGRIVVYVGQEVEQSHYTYGIPIQQFDGNYGGQQVIRGKLETRLKAVGINQESLGRSMGQAIMLYRLREQPSPFM